MKNATKIHSVSGLEKSMILEFSIMMRHPSLSITGLMELPTISTMLGKETDAQE